MSYRESEEENDALLHIEKKIASKISYKKPFFILRKPLLFDIYLSPSDKAYKHSGREVLFLIHVQLKWESSMQFVCFAYSSFCYALERNMREDKQPLRSAMAVEQIQCQPPLPPPPFLATPPSYLFLSSLPILFISSSFSLSCFPYGFFL